MLFNDVCIESISHYLPDKILTSDEIEKKLYPLYSRLKLPLGRLELISGISQRRIWNKGVKPSDCATKAGQLALNEAFTKRCEVDCLINSSVSRDFMEPATASIIHKNLELDQNSMIFDLSNACLGFLNSMVVAANMISQGSIKTALIVSGENSEPLINSTINNLNSDRTLTRKSVKESFASLTIGSGAAAAVLKHYSISKTKHQILGGAVLTNSNFNYLCNGDFTNNKLLMKTDSETLLNEGCKLASNTWQKTKEILGLNNCDFNHFICHQVGRAHQKVLLEKLEIPPEKDFSTYKYLGNMGSVSLPATLSIASEKSLKKDDLIALLGIGSGINCMMLGVKW